MALDFIITMKTIEILQTSYEGFIIIIFVE